MTPPEDPRSKEPESTAPPEPPDVEAPDARGAVESAQERVAPGEDGGNVAEPSSARLFRVDSTLDPGLYVVATPIGNLRDITLRALDVLASVDCVYAEDTRVAGKLMSAYGVSARLRPYHDHNGAEVRPLILRELEAGERIALVSDAGTPLISDPGFKLVREAARRGIVVRAVPGATTPVAALSVAGLPTDRFLFAGFPPPRSAARRSFLAELADAQATLVMFEGASRLAESLADMAEVLGPREAVVARELTKLFEEVRRGRLDELARAYAEEGAPRGEIVVLVGPPSAREAPAEGDIDAALAAADAGRPVKEVAAEIADRFGLKRRDVYARALKLRALREDE